MRCTRCNDREAVLENAAVGATLFGALCRECATELIGGLAAEAGLDLKGLTPEQLAEGLFAMGQRVAAAAQKEPFTIDPREIARRLRDSGGGGEPAA